MAIESRKIYIWFLLALVAIFLNEDGVILSPQIALGQGVNKNEVIRKWLILGPIPIPRSKGGVPDEEVLKKAFETNFLGSCGEEGRVLASLEKSCSIFGKSYSWRFLRSEQDKVDFIKKWRMNDFAIAYAWAEIEEPNPSTLMLGLGSDDAVKVWLNGLLIPVMRELRRNDDIVKLDLRPGRNQILLKVLNGQLRPTSVLLQISPEMVP